jgi:hypothetical protein
VNSPLRSKTLFAIIQNQFRKRQGLVVGCGLLVVGGGLWVEMIAVPQELVTAAHDLQPTTYNPPPTTNNQQPTTHNYPSNHFVPAVKSVNLHYRRRGADGKVQTGPAFCSCGLVPGHPPNLRGKN